MPGFWLRSSGSGENLWGASVDQSHSLADGLVAAWLPTPGGYWDAGRLQVPLINPKGTPQLTPSGAGKHGLGFDFTTSTALTTERPLPIMADGLSVAVWVKFPTGTPTTYGSHVSRAGTVGATNAGGDWDIAANGTNRQLSYGRNGALIATASSVVSGGIWYLWHFSLTAAGAWNWWLSGADIGTIARGSGSGAGFRTATGVMNVNARSTDASNNGNSSIGPVYLWHRATQLEEAQQLFADEKRLVRTRRIWVPGSVASGVVGTLSKTLVNDVLSGSGVTTVLGSLSRILAADTLLAGGTTTVVGSLVKTLEDSTTVASGAVGGISGSLTSSLLNNTISSSGTTTILGTVGSTLLPNTLSASGTSTIMGTLTSPLMDDLMAATGYPGTPPLATAKLPLVGVGT